MHDAGQVEIDYSAGVQLGDRRPAPGRLGLIQAFSNSYYDFEGGTGVDFFADEDSLRDWCARRGLISAECQLRRGDAARARAVRDGFRALLRANNGIARDEAKISALNQAAEPVQLRPRIDHGRIELAPPADGVDGVLGRVLTIAMDAIGDGSWQRLKACQEDTCQWAFYDHSRNGASSWCSMRVCGGRAKQRAYYDRKHS